MPPAPGYPLVRLLPSRACLRFTGKDSWIRHLSPVWAIVWRTFLGGLDSGGENNSKNSDSSMRGKLRLAAAASNSAAIWFKTRRLLAAVRGQGLDQFRSHQLGGAGLFEGKLEIDAAVFRGCGATAKARTRCGFQGATSSGDLNRSGSRLSPHRMVNSRLWESK